MILTMGENFCKSTYSPRVGDLQKFFTGGKSANFGPNRNFASTSQGGAYAS